MKCPVPWDYSDTTLSPTNPLVPNTPTDEGRALGREMARLATIERVRNGDCPLPCHDCAFELGTIPTGCPDTLMDALKCVMEGQTFFCHVNKGRPCAGWVALTRAAKRELVAGETGAEEG